MLCMGSPWIQRLSKDHIPFSDKETEAQRGPVWLLQQAGTEPGSKTFLFIAESHALSRASLVAKTVKTLPVMWETQVQSLGWEDPLERGMATPLQYSCLENPMDRGAWRSAVHGVAESDMTQRLTLSHSFCL